MKREQLRALTGVRFLAAFSVVLCHLVAAFTLRLPLPAWGSTLIAHGYLSVTFFFLLSGFILSYDYSAPDGRMRSTAASFWVARFGRIYPVYVLGLALDVVPYFAVSTTTYARIANVVANPLLLQAWIPIAVPVANQTWNTPGWSLSNEAFFYLLFPLLLPLLSKYTHRILVYIITLSWVAMALIPIALILVLSQGFQHRTTVEWKYVLDINPLIRLPEFIMGMAAGILFTRIQQVSWRPPALFADLSLVMLCGCLVFLFFSLDVYSLVPFVVPPFLCIILVLAFSRGIMAAVLGSRLFVLLGEISYGIYILHWPLWSWVEFLGIRHRLSDWALPACYLTSVLIVSALSFYLIEQPARRWIRLVWSRRQERAQDLKILATSARVGERGRAV